MLAYSVLVLASSPLAILLPNLAYAGLFLAMDIDGWPKVLHAMLAVLGGVVAGDGRPEPGCHAKHNRHHSFDRRTAQGRSHVVAVLPGSGALRRYAGSVFVGISAFTFALFERTAFSLQGNADGVIVFWDRQYYISTVMTGLSHGVMTGFTALACAWLLLGNNRPRLPAFRGWACLRRSPRTPSTIQPLPSTGLATIPSSLRPLCTR